MDNPPVILVHGLGSSFEHGWRAAGWIDLLQDAGRTVVPFDVLGHGRADAPHDPAAYRHLDRCIDAALPGKPVDAIGFSLGAQLVLRAAARDSSRFHRLVVIGVGTNLFQNGDFEFLAELFERGEEPEDITARLFVQLARSAGNDLKALAALLRRGDEPFTKEELARVACPTLVVIGDRDFAGPADPLVDALPDAKLRLLPGVDHFRAPTEFGCIDASLEFIGAAP
jgi:pimeloyl-ACP methyl ester carboxylesterase